MFLLSSSLSLLINSDSLRRNLNWLSQGFAIFTRYIHHRPIYDLMIFNSCINDLCLFLHVMWTQHRLVKWETTYKLHQRLHCLDNWSFDSIFILVKLKMKLIKLHKLFLSGSAHLISPPELFIYRELICAICS